MRDRSGNENGIVKSKKFSVGSPRSSTVLGSPKTPATSGFSRRKSTCRWSRPGSAKSSEFRMAMNSPLARAMVAFMAAEMPRILFEDLEPDTRIDKAADDVGGAVGRTVVGHDDLEILERLIEDAADGLADIVGVIVRFDDDGDLGVHRDLPRVNRERRSSGTPHSRGSCPPLRADARQTPPILLLRRTGRAHTMSSAR